jgi:hypothetical protein
VLANLVLLIIIAVSTVGDYGGVFDYWYIWS